ncbi:capsid cement protein [Hoyosella altamirensis]|uniref:DUF2190 domain-containing protein n=1 Tax=Hoyosella altamirensis TaxID=616997 RepID=A0A839RM21_9ACTN|nr:capsid cement protein [Hoyosella altamirensis]MBB3037430.1 hypothetical protein [Hoyosella altamirensis]MBB3037447.1 hypothetical protein [Hoyosella altamirensis]
MPLIGVDVFNPGGDLSARATTAINRRQFVTIAGDTDPDGAPTIEVADEGALVFGVAKHDAKEGELVAVARGAGRVVTVKASAPITAGQIVEANSGDAAPHGTGQPAGQAINTVPADGTAHISLR